MHSFSETRSDFRIRSRLPHFCFSYKTLLLLIQNTSASFRKRNLWDWYTLRAQEEYIYINVVFNLLATWNSHFIAQFLFQLLFLRFVKSKFLSPGEIFSLISRVRVTSATLTGSWRSKTIFKKSGHYKKR